MKIPTEAADDALLLGVEEEHVVHLVEGQLHGLALAALGAAECGAVARPSHACHCPELGREQQIVHGNRELILL